jgi:NAD(P)-dependent dehydrogenase (short-subunit alcohol dehydrogenase family)
MRFVLNGISAKAKSGALEPAPIFGNVVTLIVPHGAREDILNWDTRSIPDLTGKTAIVTGASSGIGKEAARALAAKNAEVTLAVRSAPKGEAAAADIRQSAPQAKVLVEVLDVASLASVAAFAERLRSNRQKLDLLVNNAGVMFPPYGKTEDGYELHLATNHLGHFALTGRLLPLLLAAPDARIVTVASLAHSSGNLNFDDINWEKRKYVPYKAYGDSKLANLLFTYELARRLKTRGASLRAIAAHPGMTKTELTRHTGPIMHFFENFLFQDAAMGALPTLRAACDPDAQSGDYFGPSGFIEGTGPPVKVKSNAMSHDQALAARLWAFSEQATGVSY